MATSLGNMVIHLGLDSQGVATGAKSAMGQLTNLKGSVEGTGSGMGLLAGGISKVTAGMAAAAAGAVALAGSVAGIAAVSGWGLQLAASAEDSRVAFETMLGSTEKAKTLLGELKDFAKATPFAFPELEASARKLLAFGVGAGDITNSLRMIGDVSAGIGAPISEIAELFGKAKVQGTLYAEDINQLVGRGIPVIQEFAKQLGVSEGEVKKLASEGKISFENLRQAFESLTAEGSQFGGLMAKQGATLNGLWGTLWDTLGEIGTSFGQALAPGAKKIVEALQKLADKFGGFVEANLPLIEEFANRVADIVVAAIEEIGEMIEEASKWAEWLTETAEYWGVIEERAKKATKAGKDVGAATEAIATGMQQAQAETEKLTKLMERGKSLTESLRLPDEVFNDNIAEIKELYDAGAISLETVMRAITKAQDDLQSATKQMEADIVSVGAAERYTSEGFSAAAAGQREVQRQLELQQRQYEQERQQTLLLQQIRDKPSATPIKQVSI